MRSEGVNPQSIAVALLSEIIHSSLRSGRTLAQITTHFCAQYGSGGHSVTSDENIRAITECLGQQERAIEEVELRVIGYTIVRQIYLDRVETGQTAKELVREIASDRELLKKYPVDKLHAFAKELLVSALKTSRAA